MLSIIIPTRNRSHFLGRLLQYYGDVGCPHNIIVADSSDSDHLIDTQRVVDSFRTKLAVNHRMYDSNIEIREKLSDALENVLTPYSAVAADDDFLIPSSLSRAMQFLQEHPDYSVAHGDAVLFGLEHDGAYGRIRSAERYAQRSIEDPTGAHRLLSHLAQYSPTWYSVQRTEFSQEHYRKTVDLKTDLTFIELLPSLLSLIRGKAKKLDMLYMVRQAHAQQTSTNSGNHQTVFDWVSGPAWSGQFQTLLDCLAAVMAQQDKISEEAAQETIKQAFWSYIARGLMIKWDARYGKNDSRFHSRISKMAAKIPAFRGAWRQVRSFIPSDENEVSLPALLRPGSKYHSDFMPIYRVITEPV